MRLTRFSLALLAGLITLAAHAPSAPRIPKANPPVQGPRLGSTQNSLIQNPPIIIGAIRLPRLGPVYAVYAEDPAKVVDTGLGITQVTGEVWWAKDHRSCILSQSGPSMVISTYDPIGMTFGKPRELTTKIPQHPDSHWPIGWSEDAEHREAQLRRTIKRYARLPTSEVMSDVYAWSPDESQIAYQSESKTVFDEEAQPFRELWVISPASNGTKPRRLGFGARPSWSPDGRHIVAIEGSHEDGRRIVQYDVVSGRKRVLRTAKWRCLECARYSPDGRYIAVFGAYNPADESKQGIFLMDSSGKFLRVLATQEQLGSVAIPVPMDW